ADAQRIFARVEAVLREHVAALRVGGHADLDDRAGPFSGDDDAFHVAFGLGADRAGQRLLALRPDRLRRWMEQHHRCTGGEAQHQFASHRALPDENLFVAVKRDSLGRLTDSVDTDAAMMTPLGGWNK